MGEIYIAQPYVEKCENDLYRLCANINVNGNEELLFVEVEPQYKDYLTWERSDAFVLLTLPIALREGYDIRCDAPVSEMFLHNLTTTLIPALCQGDARAAKVKIFAESDGSELGTEHAVGASVTCGVDSTHTIMEYTNEKYDRMKLTHLLVGSVSSDLWGVYGDDNLRTWEEKYTSRFERYYEVSEYTGLPIVKVFTNFVPFIIRRRAENVWYKHVNNHIYITMAMVMTLKKLFGIYYFSSAYDFSHFTLKDNLSYSPSEYELLLMHAISTPDFMCFSAGATVDRIDKTVALADYPLAQKILHPCFEGGRMNCSSPLCSKCLRGLFTLDYYDKLDQMSEVYDIKRYRKHKQEYLLTLIRDKDTVNFSQLYGMIMEKYPEEMQEAQVVYDDKTEPVSKNEYETLLTAYENVLKLLSQDRPRNTVVGFFQNKGIAKLYYEGSNSRRKLMAGLLGDSVEIVTSKTGDVNECDAVFLGGLRDKDIANEKARFNESMKAIYTFRDVFVTNTSSSITSRMKKLIFKKEKEGVTEEQMEMVSRKKFISLERGYETGLQLLAQDSPKDMLIRFFKDNGIGKLYYANPTKLGDKVVALISDDITVVTEKTGEVNDCDAAFVGVLLNHSIKKAKINITCKKNKEMRTYTYKDIQKACE